MALSAYQKRRRLALAALLGIAFCSLFFVGSAWGEEAHEAVELLGLVAMTVGIAGRLWCTLYIGGRKAREVVAKGPYSISRNPLYVFSSIAAFGIGASVGSLILGLLFTVGCAVAFHFVIRREEAYLQDRFGATYAAYMARVPRFLPNFALYADERRVSVDVQRIYRTLRDGLVFFAAMPFFETVEWLQHENLLPILTRLY